MRKIIGFAVLAVVAWILLKVFFSLLGVFIGLGVTILMAALVGYCIYLVLRIIAPGLADKISGAISGHRAPSDLDRV